MDKIRQAGQIVSGEAGSAGQLRTFREGRRYDTACLPSALLEDPSAEKGSYPRESRGVEQDPVGARGVDQDPVGARLEQIETLCCPCGLVFVRHRLEAAKDQRSKEPTGSAVGTHRPCNTCSLPSQILASTSRTDAANHLPPRAVGMPRSLRALAMARSEVAPLACSSVITGARCRPRAQPRPLHWRPRPSGGPS
jgi:hypothetical protein